MSKYISIINFSISKINSINKDTYNSYKFYHNILFNKINSINRDTYNVYKFYHDILFN